MHRRLQRVGMIVALSLLIASSRVEAAPILYLDFAAFDAATNITNTADFEGIANPNAHFVGTTGTFSGITFTGENDRLFIFDRNNYDPVFASDFLNLNDFGVHFINIAVNHTAVGFDFSNLNVTFKSPVAINIAITDGSGTTNFTVAAPVQPGLAFFGITSDSLITSAVVRGEMVVLDNVSIGDAVPVPEPASMTLLGIGLAGLGAARWRRRHNS